MPILYEDRLYRVTDSVFESGATSYRISSITSIVGPLHESMDFFGGLLLNAGLAVLGLIGIFSFHAIWMLLGLGAAALGGFNVWGQFHRPWWIRLTFANGEDLRIVKPDEDAINRLHDAIRSVMS